MDELCSVTYRSGISVKACFLFSAGKIKTKPSDNRPSIRCHFLTRCQLLLQTRTRDTDYRTSVKWSRTFLPSRGLPRDGAFVQQRPVSLDQVLPAEHPTVLHPALRFGLQTQADLSQASGFLVFFDLIVHLRDAVFDQRQTLNQRLVLLCVGWGKKACCV